MSFRGINTTVIQIRRQVFTEVARMAYANVKGEQANHLMRKIPYTVIPGEEGKLRKDIFLERAIVEERVRLAMGLPTRRMDEHNSVVSGLEDAGNEGVSSRGRQRDGGGVDFRADGHPAHGARPHETEPAAV